MENTVEQFAQRLEKVADLLRISFEARKEYNRVSKIFADACVRASNIICGSK